MASDDTTAASKHGDSESDSKQPTRIFLVRHAVTAETGPKLTGRAPGVALSEDGVVQATATSKRLADFPIAAVYASPIERTAQTAALVGAPHSLEPIAHEGLLEADYGDWTGGRIADLAKTEAWKVVQAAPSRAVFPNGESIRSMQARIVSAVEELVLRHSHESVVVVSHADPIKSAIAYFTGVHLDLFQRIQVSPASVSVLDFHAFGSVLQKLNDTGSLDELRAPDSSSGERAA